MAQYATNPFTTRPFGNRKRRAVGSQGLGYFLGASDPPISKITAPQVGFPPGVNIAQYLSRGELRSFFASVASQPDCFFDGEGNPKLRAHSQACAKLWGKFLGGDIDQAHWVALLSQFKKMHPAKVPVTKKAGLGVGTWALLVLGGVWLVGTLSESEKKRKRGQRRGLR